MTAFTFAAIAKPLAALALWVISFFCAMSFGSSISKRDAAFSFFASIILGLAALALAYSAGAR